MSRIGKLPIKVPDKVNITINPTNVIVTGPKGELSKDLPDSIKIIQNEKTILVVPKENVTNSHQLYGTFRSLINNMIVGVTQGFQKN